MEGLGRFVSDALGALTDLEGGDWLALVIAGVVVHFGSLVVIHRLDTIALAILSGACVLLGLTLQAFVVRRLLQPEVPGLSRKLVASAAAQATLLAPALIGIIWLFAADESASSQKMAVIAIALIASLPILGAFLAAWPASIAVDETPFGVAEVWRRSRGVRWGTVFTFSLAGTLGRVVGDARGNDDAHGTLLIAWTSLDVVAFVAQIAVTGAVAAQALRHVRRQALLASRGG